MRSYFFLWLYKQSNYTLLNRHIDIKLWKFNLYIYQSSDIIVGFFWILYLLNIILYNPLAWLIHKFKFRYIFSQNEPAQFPAKIIFTS